MNNPCILAAVLAITTLYGCELKTPPEKGEAKMSDKVQKTDAEWRQSLTEDEYYILRKKGTERAFTGEYDEFFQPGVYVCAGCGNELFVSDNKYNSGCGWPAFDRPSSDKSVKFARDASHGMRRTEVICRKCGGHLGHVFKDGPKTTGNRYCINSAALDFEEKKEESKSTDD